MAMTCGVQVGNVLGGRGGVAADGASGLAGGFCRGRADSADLAAALALWLPETFTARKRRGFASIPRLFEGGFARLTLTLWLINFLSLLTIYFINSWLPSLLHSLGIATASAMLAASMFHLGGMTGTLASAPLANRFGTENVVAAMLAMGGCFLILLGLAHGTALLFAGLAFGTGLGISAGQLGINALSGAVYPLELRDTGAGWALGRGKAGQYRRAPVRRPVSGAGLAARAHACW